MVGRMNDFVGEVTVDEMIRSVNRTKPVRTITEILKDADKTKTKSGLIDLWSEFLRNKKQYPLIELWFAEEHINKLIQQL